MVNSSTPVHRIFKDALRSIDGRAMYLSVFYYIYLAAYLFDVEKFKAYICLLMVPLIFLFYLSLRIYSSEGKISGWINAAIIAYINYIFFDKIIHG